MEKKKISFLRNSRSIQTTIDTYHGGEIFLFPHISPSLSPLRERDRSTTDRGLKRVDHEGGARANKLSAVLTDDGDSLDITSGSGGGPPTKSFDPHYHRAKLRSRG